MTTSEVIQIVLAIVGAIGSIIGWLVVRSISAADENLSAIRKDVSEARAEVTALLVHRQHDRNEIDDHSRQLMEHSRKHDEHAIKFAEQHGEIAILKSKVP